jgi:hypothetical protein
LEIVEVGLLGAGLAVVGGLRGGGTGGQDQGGPGEQEKNNVFHGILLGKVSSPPGDDANLKFPFDRMETWVYGHEKLYEKLFTSKGEAR